MTIQTITLEEAQNGLPDLIAKLAPGMEIVITRADEPVARLISEPKQIPQPVPGRCAGMLTIVSEDDEHLADWADYMP